MESNLLTSIESSSLSLRQNPLEWGWGFAFVGQSLKHMVANCGRRHEILSGRSSI